MCTGWPSRRGEAGGEGVKRACGGAVHRADNAVGDVPDGAGELTVNVIDVLRSRRR